MDPLLTLNLVFGVINKLLDIWFELWKATPDDQKHLIAGNLGSFCVNIGNWIISIQNDIMKLSASATKS
jgi:hypothetical protein